MVLEKEIEILQMGKNMVKDDVRKFMKNKLNYFQQKSEKTKLPEIKLRVDLQVRTIEMLIELLEKEFRG